MLEAKPSSAFVGTILIFFLTAFSAAQATQMVKDSKGACQISVPENWGQSVTLVRGGGKLRIFDEQTQKFYVEKMFENTPARVFYLSKPTTSGATTMTYQVSAPANGFHCIAQIIVKAGYPEDQVKKIAATLGPAK